MRKLIQDIENGVAWGS